jgi:hypothetical protein
MAHMRSRITAIIIGLSLLGGVDKASAAVVTFDDPAVTSIVGEYFGPGGAFSDQGLTFTLIGPGSGALMSVSNGSALTSPNSNGTNNLIMCCGPPYYVEITKTGGGTFTLNSIDFAISLMTACQPTV